MESSISCSNRMQLTAIVAPIEARYTVIESSTIMCIYTTTMSKIVNREELKETVRLAKAGNVSAFTHIVSRHQDYIRAFIATRTNHPQDVDDIAQETFLLAFQKLSDLAETSALKSWLTGIALNLVRNHARKHHRITLEEHSKIEALIHAKIDAKIDDTNDASHLSIAALKACLLKMKHENQALVKKHYLEGCSVKTLTEDFGVKHSTMTMRLHRCRQLLKDCISKRLQGADHD